MKQQVRGIRVDVTPRNIMLTWEHFEAICEALHGLNSRSGPGGGDQRQKRGKIASYLIKEWHKQDEK